MLLDLRAQDPHEAPATDDSDTLGELLRTGDTRWNLDLDDPSLWHDLPEPQQLST